MDFEEKRKRQMIRVIIAEVGMVLAVVAIVVVSMMAAMGFMISGNGSIEQTGLLQLHTLPTGASVNIDGATVFGRTNLSRTLSAGEHAIEIYRDGYDTWKNTIKVRSGVLIRLYYPRLFLTNRTAEVVKGLTAEEGENLSLYQPSPRRNYILYMKSGSSEWNILDLRGDEVRVSVADMSKILPGMVEDKTKRKVTGGTTESNYKFLGRIDEVHWSDNEESVLVKVTYEEKSEWVMVRLKDVSRSVNLTRTFGLSADVRLEMIDSAASHLYVLEKRQLRRIDMSNIVMSRILLDNVIDFMSDEEKVIYLTGTSDNKNRSIGVYRDDENGGTILAKVADDVKVKIALASYYDDDYMIWTENQKVQILYGRMPSYDENGANLGGLKNLVTDITFEEMPSSLTVSPGGEYLLARNGKKIMAVDLAEGELYEYEALSDQVRWFDDSMLYAVIDNQIEVWDFDGANWRNLSKDVKVKVTGESVKVNNNSLVMVASNNRYIYYLMNVDGLTNLMREQIRD